MIEHKNGIYTATLNGKVIYQSTSRLKCWDAIGLAKGLK